MTDNKEMLWNIVLIVSIILIIRGISDTGDMDKKTAQIAQNTATLGAVGLASTAFRKTSPALLTAFASATTWRWIAWPITAFIAFFPSFINRTVDIFRPEPTIPSWIWIGAFVVIIILVMRKK